MNVMKKIKQLFVVLCVACLGSSCQEWLTIQPETQVTKDEMFKTPAGFNDALAGCYTLLRNNYEPDMNMMVGAVELMANLWTVTEGNWAYDLAVHDYRADLVESQLGSVFLQQYEVIANLNLLLEYVETQDRVLTDDEYKLYKGEALGLRAFVHFDLIRMWGPVPKQVNDAYKYLPYEKNLQLENYPYSTYRDYMDDLCTDLDSAEVLLRDSKDYGYYNRKQMNYYAILGLQARVHLWLGEKEEALRYARLVKDAVSTSGGTLFALGTQEDLNRYDRVFYTHEQLFGLDVEEFNDNLLGDGDLAQFKQRTVYLTSLYNTNDIRLQLWFADDGKGYRSPNKYDNWASFDTEVTGVEKSVPLIRLSEMYLIIAECAPLEEANEVYQEFLFSRGVAAEELTEENREEVILKEYLREFYAEGQMFFVYKRLGTVTMQWSSKVCGEDAYVLPLPLRELSTVENY